MSSAASASSNDPIKGLHEIMDDAYEAIYIAYSIDPLESLPDILLGLHCLFDKLRRFSENNQDHQEIILAVFAESLVLQKEISGNTTPLHWMISALKYYFGQIILQHVGSNDIDNILDHWYELISSLYATLYETKRDPEKQTIYQRLEQAYDKLKKFLVYAPRENALPLFYQILSDFLRIPATANLVHYMQKFYAAMVLLDLPYPQDSSLKSMIDRFATRHKTFFTTFIRTVADGKSTVFCITKDREQSFRKFTTSTNDTASHSSMVREILSGKISLPSSPVTSLSSTSTAMSASSNSSPIVKHTYTSPLSQPSSFLPVMDAADDFSRYQKEYKNAFYWQKLFKEYQVSEESRIQLISWLTTRFTDLLGLYHPLWAIFTSLRLPEQDDTRLFILFDCLGQLWSWKETRSWVVEYLLTEINPTQSQPRRTTFRPIHALFYALSSIVEATSQLANNQPSQSKRLNAAITCLINCWGCIQSQPDILRKEPITPHGYYLLYQIFPKLDFSKLNENLRAGCYEMFKTVSQNSQRPFPENVQKFFKDYEATLANCPDVIDASDLLPSNLGEAPAPASLEM